MILSESRKKLIPIIFSKNEEINTIRDLLRVTDISQNTIRETINELKQLGLIDLVNDGPDRRIKRIHIIEDNPNTVLCKLFGFDPSQPFKIIHKEQQIP